MAQDPGGTLCRACGICCGGALFSSGALTDDEAIQLRTRLRVIPVPGKNYHDFSIPCPAHGPSGCTVYDERPVTCVEYACLLLRRVRAGEVTEEGALRTVTDLKAQIAALEAELPPGSSFWDRAGKLRAAAEPGAAAERRRLASTLLDLKVLERRLARDLDDRIGKPAGSPTGG